MVSQVIVSIYFHYESVKDSQVLYVGNRRMSGMMVG